MEDNHSIHIEGRSPVHAWEPAETYREEFEHPLWKEFLAMGVRGGHPVSFPDFTRGKWIHREPGPASKYSLEI